MGLLGLATYAIPSFFLLRVLVCYRIVACMWGPEIMSTRTVTESSR